MKKCYSYMGKSNICFERLRELRKAKRLTQKELAAQVEARFAMKFSASSLCRIERGTQFVPDYELAALAKVLGVEPKELMMSIQDLGE